MPPKHRETREDYQQKFEKAFLEEKRQGNDPKQSIAWMKLVGKFGPKISQEELLSLARVVSHELNIDLAREYKRRKETLIYWFNENFEKVWPFVEHNVFVYSKTGELINENQHQEKK